MRGRIVKKLTIAAMACSLAISAYAVAPGFYLGLMTGPATNSGGTQYAQMFSPSNGLTPAYPKSTQWGTRLYMGNKLNQFVSIEGGLDYFTGVQYDTKNVATCSGTQVRIRGFDVVGKVDYTLASINLFAKAGPSILYQTLSGDLNADLAAPCGKSVYTTKIRPTIAIGASYEMNQNWLADFTLTRFMTGGPVANADMYTIGFTYHFVNIYCGQFLCDN
jgi:hypothetical protein